MRQAEGFFSDFYATIFLSPVNELMTVIDRHSDSWNAVLQDCSMMEIIYLYINKNYKETEAQNKVLLCTPTHMNLYLCVQQIVRAHPPPNGDG